MPANEFNIGKDVKLDVVDPRRGLLRFSIVTGWEAAAQYDDLNSKGLDGKPRFDAIPNGWRLTLGLDRADPEVDNFFAEREELYFSGSIVPKVTITETITERRGGVSQFRYTDISLRLEGGGTWRGNAITTQSVVGMAARRIKVI